YSNLADKPNATSSQRMNIIKDSAKEIGPAILIAVLTTVVTFVPVFALEGAEGKLFVPLAWAKTLAMLGAVFVAIVLTPVLSIFMLKGELKPIEKNKVSRIIVNTYKPLLNWVLEHRKKFILAPVFAC